MIVYLFAARLLTDAAGVYTMISKGDYGWTVVFAGLAVADAGTVWLLRHG